MHAAILVEDNSTEATVAILLSRLLANHPEHTAEIVPFGGKQRMLGRLRERFYMLARSHYADQVIVVIDQDTDDCEALKRRIYDDAVSAGLVLRYQSTPESSLRIRIAMTELESWFIGDPAAVRAAYPRITERDLRLRRRDPDALSDASEWLGRRLTSHGYYSDRMRKIEAAQAIAPHLNLAPDANASQSFRLFLRTLRETYGLG